MTGPESRTRSRLYLAGAVLVPLAVALTWTLLRATPPSPDDPSELLRRASASNAGKGAKPTGKVIAAEVTSSSGEPVQVRMPEVRDDSGQVGFAVHLAKPLKPGDTATVKMPGGGSVTIGAPKDGEAPKPPGRPRTAVGR